MRESSSAPRRMSPPSPSNATPAIERALLPLTLAINDTIVTGVEASMRCDAMLFYEIRGH